MCHFIAIHGLKFQLPYVNAEIRAKFSIFSPCVTLRLDRWPLNTAMRPLCATPNFVHNFKTISGFKLWLQWGNAQFGSKSPIFRSMWLWNFTDARKIQQGTSSMPMQAICIICKPSINSDWSYSPETFNLSQTRPKSIFCLCVTLKFVGCPKNNGKPLLCQYKLCASFRSHRWIKTGVIVWIRSIWVKFGDIFHIYIYRFSIITSWGPLN